MTFYDVLTLELPIAHEANYYRALGGKTYTAEKGRNVLETIIDDGWQVLHFAVGRERYHLLMKKHTHDDECWEPDSGCDLGRNERYAVSTPVKCCRGTKGCVYADTAHAVCAYIEV